MARRLLSLITMALFLASPALSSQQPAPPLSPADVTTGTPPPAPPGTEKVLSFDKYGTRVAACAQKAGAPIERGARQFPPTEVWITDGKDVWKTGAVIGACDPAWSPDGAKLAVAAPDGLWILSDTQQQKGERFTDVRDADAAGTEFAAVTFSKPQWSPDGTRLAALVSNGQTSWVEVMDVTTGKLLVKSEPESYAFKFDADSRTLRVDGRKTIKIP